MPDDFAFPKQVMAACEDSRDAWDFLRHFAARWAVPLDERSGCGDEELAAAERRLGLSLPPAMREGYALLGKRDDLTSSQDTLLGPERLHLDETGRALVFRVENQSVVRWAIAVDDLQMADPPVIFQSDVPCSAPEPWRPFLGRFSLAWIEMVLTEYLLGDHGHYDNRESDTEALETLEHHYTRLAIPDYPMWADPQGPPIRWFWGPDVLIRDDGRAWLWAAARTPQALQAVRRAVPGDWLMGPT
ncbi:hypothetical protein [Actinoallomurus rhizosphaericola]|uniref:hypothetical protein n=1 Tax=Actinoallomurus rhizosphaericola TaxID=2952536 RepID=UPI0020920C90|nr:hypothetical protein [Actinoallomurus rhizosphaericola]MCO5997638.1 hypothetical protein [Actinoallomurus rhizosphaericola]